jgi:hypothetical protein
MPANRPSIPKCARIGRAYTCGLDVATQSRYPLLRSEARHSATLAWPPGILNWTSTSGLRHTRWGEMGGGEMGGDTQDRFGDRFGTPMVPPPVPAVQGEWHTRVNGARP